MEQKLQTKVTDQNRQQYLTAVWPQLTKSKNELVQLFEYTVPSFVIADSCGWYYKSLWSELNIIGLETASSIREYQFEEHQFQGVIDNTDYNDIKWPQIDSVGGALIFDHSVILKYRTVEEIVNIISNAAATYQSRCVVFRAATVFIDDCRLADRMTSLSKLLLPGYVVESFAYNPNNIKISYRKKLDV